MKFTKIAMLGLLLAAAAPLAFADVITGEIDTGGTATITSTSITFASPKAKSPNKFTSAGTVLAGYDDLSMFSIGNAGLYIAGAPTHTAKYTFPTLGSANPGVLLFMTVEDGETLDFYVTEIDSVTLGVNPTFTGPHHNIPVKPGVTGAISGDGYITLTGNPDPQDATFFLTSVAPGTGSKAFSLQIISDAVPTPEPGGLALLGTGLLGLFGIGRRKFLQV
jgi:hypothetical protein